MHYAGSVQYRFNIGNMCQIMQVLRLRPVDMSDTVACRSYRTRTSYQESICLGIDLSIELRIDDRPRRALFSFLVAMCPQRTHCTYTCRAFFCCRQLVFPDPDIFVRLPPLVQNCEWDQTTCTAAIFEGQLDALRWARDNGCPWDPDACRFAAGHGHLELLAWCKENGGRLDVKICINAAGSGHLDVRTLP